ncbi:MAG: hypothetical protein HY795_15645 [Desulfovibrio sp.]|nr:hypothetical protein [Desulfovibrio sp.]MBI4958745.1 hypothetical protein [Desulfovibrio sp.]
MQMVKIVDFELGDVKGEVRVSRDGFDTYFDVYIDGEYTGIKGQIDDSTAHDFKHFNKTESIEDIMIQSLIDLATRADEEFFKPVE